MLGTHVLGQTITITGTVTDASDGSTLPGVSVTIQGTTVGVTTDVDGNYQIDAPSDAVLQFSFIGMMTEEVPVEGRTTINVEMIPELVALEEVLVIAYGTARRESFTGVADVISSDRLERRQVSNITRALEGSAPGVQVTSGGGQPGAGMSVRLRGFGSMSASNEPLYVVDGAPFSGNINSINPDDIESITILRDASAAALYGARGANGVVMITTKRGSADRPPQINFTARVGTANRAMPEYPRLSTDDWMVAQFEAYRNYRHFAGGLSLEEANASTYADLLGTLGRYNAYNMSFDELFILDDDNPWLVSLNPNAELLWDEDFQDELFRTALRQEYMFNASGGTDISDYFLSLSYLDEEGMAITSGFERISTRLNVNTQPVDWFETGLNVNASMADYDFLLAEGTYTTNPFFYSRMMGPIYPVYLKDERGYNILDDDGNKILDWGQGDGPQGTRPYAAMSNLVGSLKLDDRSFKRENVGARIFTQFNLMEGLNFRTTLSTDYYSLYQTTFQNPEYGDAAAFRGRGTKIHQRNLSVTFNQLLNYSTSFGDHNIDFLLGHEAYFLNFNYASATRTGFPVPGITEIGIATSMEGSTSYAHEYTLEGYFTRLSYDYDNRYYASASFRRDGSSRFYKDSRWGNFWSFGASWRVTQEDFMQGIDWLDNLRVKASYGEQGNDALPTYYAWQSFYSLGWDNFNLPGAIYTSHENRDLVWESSENFNVGFDFRIFDMFTGEFDYFIRQSTNLLMSVPLPLSTGVPEIDMNVGAMANRGIEFRAILDILQRRDLRWSIDLNLTHLTNEITDMPEQLEGTIVGTKRWEVGRSYYEYYLREVSHIDPVTGNTMFYYDITDEDGEVIGRGTTSDINRADRYFIGETSIPDLFGAFTNNFAYGNWDLSFMFSYGIGGKMYDNIYSWLMHEGRLGYHMHVDINERWRSPAENVSRDDYKTYSDFPKVQHENRNLYPGVSDQYLKDMTYLSLRNVTLGYNLPRRFAEQIGISNLRLFVAGENIYTWNQHEGMDPQHSFTGVTDHTYVPVRTFTFGVNLQF